MDDSILRLELSDFVSLREAAFVTPPPALTEIYTISFWFFLTDCAETKIMASLGNKTLAQEGWTVFIQGSRLHVRANLNGESLQVSTFFAPSVWQHLSVILNRRTGDFEAFLNGATNLTREAAQELVEAGSVSSETQLVIGGYTDDAGGHFNYRFGEVATELLDDFRMYARALSRSEIASFITQGNSPVTASFTVVQQDSLVGFEAHSAEGLNCVWDFGDGSSALGARVEHRYAFSGHYEVSLHVFDQHHQHAIATSQFDFKGVSELPEKIPVFVNGTEGYACFRIPAVVQAANGDVLAFAEGRLAGCSDATQIIHIVCKRSLDRGKSWLPLQVVARNRVDGVEYACMNPSPVVDSVKGSGKIIVVYNKMEHSEWAITQGQGITRVCCISSFDHGASWEDEQDITVQVHKPYRDTPPDLSREVWRKQVPTLGHAIQLHGIRNPSTRGRFFFIGCYTEGSESVFYTQNYAFWSDDLGKSWHMGDTISFREDGSSARGLNEASAAELADGSVMINSRNYQDGRVVGRRAVTLGQFDASGHFRFGRARHDPTLTDSGVQASLLKHENLLVFANPDNPRARKNLTLRLSTDEGQTWSIKIVLDPGPAAYSDLVSLSPEQLGVLYEQGNHGGISFCIQTLPTCWLQ